MPGFEEEVAQRSVRFAVDLNRTAKDISHRVDGVLNLLERDLLAELRESELSGDLSPRHQRVRSLLKQTQNTIAVRMGEAEEILSEGLEGIAAASQNAALSAVNGTLQVGLMVPVLNPTELAALADNSLILGGPLEEHWSRQGAALRNRYSDQLRLGILRGESNEEIVRRVRGRRIRGESETVIGKNGKTRQVPRYSGGVMQTTTREARTLVRTSAQTVSGAVLETTYRENADVVKGVRHLSTLDSRTSHICVALAGGKWDIISGQPLPGDLSGRAYPGPPAFHPNCRSVHSPILRSWDELRGTFNQRIPETVPAERTRAAIRKIQGPGQVPARYTYRTFLNNEPVAEQRKILGATRFRLWKEGKIQLNQLINDDLEVLPVAELIRKYDR